MESEQNSVFDYAPAFVPALLFLAMFSTVFHRLKVRWPIKVNCWFCNENTKIPKQDQYWWLCPWCEQYNGFSKNGNYTRNIPEQYTLSGASTIYCRLPKQKSKYKIPKNNLCENCNKQESLKLIKLSNFKPKNEKLYNDELKVFKEYLEERYPLCKTCKLTICDVLHKQAIWLTAYKMLFFRKKPTQVLIKNARKIEITFRIISIILDLIIVYSHDFPWLAISGLFSYLCSYWTSSLRRKNFDILLIILWICISILLYVKNLATFENILFTKYIDDYYMILVCAFIIGFLSIKPSQYKNRLVLMKFKKLSHKLHSPVLSQSEFRNQNTIDSTWNEMNNSVELTDNNKLSSSKIQSYSVMNSPSNGYCLNESMSTLFLSEDSPMTRCNKDTKTAPAIFKKKTYSATSSESLFKKSSVSNNRKYILSPPKLKSVMQTSWVAGGYWQEGMPTTPTFSRSSSQSSGFGSAGSSNFASSREPSVYELDRCSVVSNTTRLSCHVVSRLVPFHVQSQREGTYSSLRHAICKTDIQENEPNVENQGNSTLMVPGHTTVMSYSWLSVLLCGSLIVNIIVLCTMLLR